MPEGREPGQFGRVEIPVEFSKRNLRKSGEVASREARRIWKEAGGKAGEEFGVESAQKILQVLNQRFRRDIGDAKEALARGLIDEKEFERQGLEAARRFNRAVLQEVEKLSTSGRKADDAITELNSSLKVTGREAREAGESGAFSFGKMRAAVAAVVGFIVGSRAVAALRDWTREGLELAQSFLRLQASAKLFNVEERELVDLSQRARESFKLTIRESNDLATQSAKLAARAGDVSQAWTVLGAALDLGAAQGLTATEVSRALEQTLRGLDEGTDKLLQRNPGDVFKEYAASLGRSAESLTDVEKKQALVNAILREGEKVAGAYDEILQTDVGTLQTWGRLIQGSKEQIGTALIPILADLARVLEGPVRRSADLFVEILDAMHVGGLAAALGFDEMRVAVLRFNRGLADLPVVGGLFGFLQGMHGDDTSAEELEAAVRDLERRRREIFQRILDLRGAGSRGGGGGGEGPPPPPDPRVAQAREQALARLEALEQDLENRLARLTRTATDELLLQLDRLEERAREAAAEAGVALSEEFVAGLERLRQDVEETRVFEDFADRFAQIQRGGGFGQVVSLEVLIQDLERAVEETEDGSVAQERLNELLQDALDLREKNAEQARKAREQTEEEAERERQRQEREEERAQTERIRRLRESARLIEENARAALQLAEAFGLVDQEAARALQSVAQLGTSIFRIAGGDLSAIPSALGALASLGSDLFGDREVEAARERQTEAMERLTEALDRAAASMEQLGSRVADMRSEDIDLLRNFERFRGGIFDREAVLQGGDAFTRDVIRAVEDVLGTQLPDFLGPEGIEGVIAQIDAILAEARRQVQSELFGTDALGRPTGSVAAREAALRGDDVEATRIRAAGEAAEQQQRATELYAAGLITAEQYQRLLAVINGELEKAVEDAEEAARRAEEATERRRRTFEADVTAREAALRGEGLEAQQDRLREQAAAELDAARDLLDAGTISEELFQRLAAVIEGELNQALEDAAEAAQRVADGFRADVVAREAVLRGDDRDALRTRIEDRNAEELAAAEELLEAGTITEELFRRLADVLDGELAQALEKFDQAAADAAFREAQDLGRLNAQILREQGRDAEALALEQQLDLEAARRSGATAEYISRLQLLHAIRLQEIQAVEASTRAIEGRTRALNAPSGFSLPDALHRSITQGAPAVSQTNTTTINREGGSFVFNIYGQEGMSAEEIARATRRQFEDWISAGGTATGFWGPSG